MLLLYCWFSCFKLNSIFLKLFVMHNALCIILTFCHICSFRKSHVRWVHSSSFRVVHIILFIIPIICIALVIINLHHTGAPLFHARSLKKVSASCYFGANVFASIAVVVLCENVPYVFFCYLRRDASIFSFHNQQDWSGIPIQI